MKRRTFWSIKNNRKRNQNVLETDKGMIFKLLDNRNRESHLGNIAIDSYRKRNLLLWKLRAMKRLVCLTKTDLMCLYNLWTSCIWKIIMVAFQVKQSDEMYKFFNILLLFVFVTVILVSISPMKIVWSSLNDHSNRNTSKLAIFIAIVALLN